MTTTSDLTALADELAHAPDWCGNLRKLASWASDGVVAMQAAIDGLAGQSLYAPLRAQGAVLITDLQDAVNRVGSMPRLSLYQMQAQIAASLGYGLTAGPTATTFNTNVTAAGGTVSSARFNLVTSTIGRLMDAGIWPLLDDLWIYRCENTAQARVGLKGSCPAGTLVNAPTFVADQQITFDGVSSRIASGFIPATHAIQMTPTNLMGAVWTASAAASAGFVYGCNGAAATPIMRTRPRSGNPTVTAVQLNTTSVTFGPTLNGLGLFTAGRNDALGATLQLSINGGPARSAPQAGATSAGIPAVEMLVGASNNNGTAANFFAGSLLALAVGKSLDTDARRKALFDALYAHLAAIAPVAL